MCLQNIKPGLNLYLRSARPTDMSRIRDIYNYYVLHSICTPEIEKRTLGDMMQRYNDIHANKMHFLVACEKGGKIKARHKKRNPDDEDIILPDKVVGFAISDDYQDMLGMYRFTAEIEVYVDNNYYMKGIGKCLLDKLIDLLDPEYIERGGYEIVGDELEGIGPSRIIKNVIAHLPYDKDKPERLEWVGRWLTNWIGFEKVGELPGIGSKDGKRYAIPICLCASYYANSPHSVNFAIFQRTTGATIDDAQPPITMEYPK